MIIYGGLCDVGQGDAVLLTRGDNQILVDGGEDEAVLTCLGRHMPFGIVVWRWSF